MEFPSVHHIGLWVADMDEMIEFLTRVLELRLVSRTSRGKLGPGERAFVFAGESQYLELLQDPQAQARPDVPVHPKGHVVGIPHLCLRVADLTEVENRLQAAGFEVSQRVSASDDFVFGSAQAIWFTGPSGVGFELFQFDRERGVEEAARGTVS